MSRTGQVDFDEFYRSTSSRVVHLVYASTGDLTLAQDCTQEAYARAWRDWARVSTHDDPLAWVRTVARRLAISEWRRGQARKRAYTRHGGPSSTAPPDVTRVAVVEALRRLGRETRETLALHYLADLSIEQISRETDTPVGTVKARLHRGRAQLAALLADTAASTGRAPTAPPGPQPAPLHATSPHPTSPRKERRHG